MIVLQRKECNNRKKIDFLSSFFLHQFHYILVAPEQTNSKKNEKKRMKNYVQSNIQPIEYRKKIEEKKTQT